MSYSFSFTKSNKNDACLEVTQQLDNVVELQPVHAEDRSAAERTAHSMILSMADDDERDIHVSMSGSIYKTEHGVQQMSLQVATQFVNREVQHHSV